MVLWADWKHRGRSHEQLLAFWCSKQREQLPALRPPPPHHASRRLRGAKAKRCTHRVEIKKVRN